MYYALQACLILNISNGCQDYSIKQTQRRCFCMEPKAKPMLIRYVVPKCIYAVMVISVPWLLGKWGGDAPELAEAKSIESTVNWTQRCLRGEITVPRSIQLQVEACLRVISVS